MCVVCVVHVVCANTPTHRFRRDCAKCTAEVLFGERQEDNRVEIRLYPTTGAFLERRWSLRDAKDGEGERGHPSKGEMNLYPTVVTPSSIPRSISRSDNLLTIIACDVPTRRRVV